MTKETSDLVETKLRNAIRPYVKKQKVVRNLSKKELQELFTAIVEAIQMLDAA